MKAKLFCLIVLVAAMLWGLLGLLPPLVRANPPGRPSLTSRVATIKQVGPVISTLALTPTVITASGNLSVTQAISDFRTLLGEPDNGDTAGQQSSGRREVSWDGVPAGLTNVNTYPKDFFNTNSPRGLILDFSAAGFRVSDNDFSDVNAAYDAEFNAFSLPKTVAPVNSNVYTATFRVAGQARPALVSGFGLVFADVDSPGSSSLELFNGSQSLGLFVAPVRSDAGGHSFVGVKFEAQAITHARIVNGQGALGAGINDISNGGSLDLVVLDNILYSEPQAIYDVYLPVVLK